MSDPRLLVARAAFKTVSIRVRDDVLDDALLAVLRAIDALARQTGVEDQDTAYCARTVWAGKRLLPRWLSRAGFNDGSR